MESDIPVLEPDENGYWAIYDDSRKIWHKNKYSQDTMMKLSDLYDKAKENRKLNSKFISLEKGESFRGQYVGVEEVMGQFGETRHYSFIMDGKERIFNKASDKFLENMVKAGVEEGNEITVKKEGEGYKTVYPVINHTNLENVKKNKDDNSGDLQKSSEKENAN